MKNDNFTQKPILAVDMDDTIVDMLPTWLNLYNQDYHDQLTPEHITQWNISRCVKAECGTKIYDYLHRDGFFRQLPVKPHSQQVLRALQNDYDIYVVTATMDFPGGMFQKFEWLQEHFSFIPTDHFVFCGDKSIIRADIMIDDGPHNLESFQGRYPILFDMPHNRAETRFVRVKNWLEVAKKLIQ